MAARKEKVVTDLQLEFAGATKKKELIIDLQKKDQRASILSRILSELDEHEACEILAKAHPQLALMEENPLTINAIQCGRKENSYKEISHLKPKAFIGKLEALAIDVNREDLQSKTYMQIAGITKKEFEFFVKKVEDPVEYARFALMQITTKQQASVLWRLIREFQFFHKQADERGLYYAEEWRGKLHPARRPLDQMLLAHRSIYYRRNLSNVASVNLIKLLMFIKYKIQNNYL